VLVKPAPRFESKMSNERLAREAERYDVTHSSRVVDEIRYGARRIHECDVAFSQTYGLIVVGDC
jgi:hypothetical protein